MSVKREIIFGSIMLFSFSLLAGIVAYFTKLILVRNLTVEEYGLFFSVLTFILFFGVFRSLGIPAGLVRFIADYRSKGKYGEIKSIIIGSTLLRVVVSFLFVILIWIFSEYLALNFFKNEDAIWLLRVMSLYMPLSIIADNLKAVFNGYRRSKYVSIVTFFQNFLVFLIIAMMFYVGFGIEAAVVGYLLSLVVLWLIFIIPFFKLTQLFSISFTNFKESNKELLVFSLPLILTSIGATFIAYFDTLMLTYFDTLENVGIYNIVYPTAMLLMIIGSSIGTILLPFFTEFWEKRQISKVREIFNVLYKYIYIIIIPLVMVLIQLSHYIVKIMFGEEYLPGVMAFNILIFASLFFIGNYLNMSSLIALKESKLSSYVYIIGAISNVLLNLILIPLYSITGAAIATTLSFMLMVSVSFYYLYRKAQLVPPFMRLGLIFLLSLVIPISVHFINLQINAYINLGIGLLVGGSIYLSLLFVCRLISLKEMRKLLFRI